MRQLMQRMTRRNEGAAAAAVPLQQTREQMRQRWQALPKRDQWALLILALFLLMVVGGYGGYSLHQAAKDSKADYQAAIADYFWLRAQANQIDTQAAQQDTTGAIDPASQVTSLLGQSGISSPQVLAVGDGVQVSFTHSSQTQASSALVALQTKGWQINQLLMQQDPNSKSIQVQATLAQ
ncbi:type II secretion system protein GspM [Psychrobacter aestuarii]|uniref:Type II secretion system protein M n=1 Tax=Psychrobacter aestuarii TaxID=556327 RepID=A0ABP3FJY1_9GAMM|nr:type II secretion system protein GspM [Psychrobacter aestuarii]